MQDEEGGEYTEWYTRQYAIENGIGQLDTKEPMKLKGETYYRSK